MITIALKYSDKYSPNNSTIEEHLKIINKYGYVWYGKFGKAISPTIMEQIKKLDTPFIILVDSKHEKYYTAILSDISYHEHEECIPEYYQTIKYNFSTWFKILSITQADNSLLSQFNLKNSGKPLLKTKSNMASFYIIEKKDM